MYLISYADPIDAQYLEALGDVGWVDWESTASGHKAHKQDAFFITEALQHLPEPLDQLVRLLNLTVSEARQKNWTYFRIVDIEDRYIPVKRKGLNKDHK